MPQKGIQWLQMYKWLHFDGESQLMSCDSHDWCKKIGKDDLDRLLEEEEELEYSEMESDYELEPEDK